MRHIAGEHRSGEPRWDYTLCGLTGLAATSVDRITLAGANDSGPDLALCPECNKVRVEIVTERRSEQFRDGEVESPEAKELREACEAAAHTFNELAEDAEVLCALRKLDGGDDLVGEIRSVALRWTEASQAFLESLTRGTGAKDDGKGSRADWTQDPFVCCGCGSEANLEVAFWVNPSTGKVDWREPLFNVSETSHATPGVQSQYCSACEKDHGAIHKSDWEKREAAK